MLISHATWYSESVSQGCTVTVRAFRVILAVSSVVTPAVHPSHITDDDSVTVTMTVTMFKLIAGPVPR
jgi:hypothetical protein